MSDNFFEMLKKAGVHVMAVDLTLDENGEPKVEVHDAADLLEPTDENGNPKEPKGDKFIVGQRVAVIDSDPPLYGHIMDICGCPLAKALGTQCIEVHFHETCAGHPHYYEGTDNYKEYRLEAMD